MKDFFTTLSLELFLGAFGAGVGAIKAGLILFGRRYGRS